MFKPDYDVGDQVTYCGQDDPPSGQAFFCAALMPPTPNTICGTHGSMACYGAFVTGAPLDDFDACWCSASWRKADSGEEIERKLARKERPVRVGEDA
jgi:hypothetical protein